MNARTNFENNITYKIFRGDLDKNEKGNIKLDKDLSVRNGFSYLKTDLRIWFL